MSVCVLWSPSSRGPLEEPCAGRGACWCGPEAVQRLPGPGPRPACSRRPLGERGSGPSPSCRFPLSSLLSCQVERGLHGQKAFRGSLDKQLTGKVTVALQQGRVKDVLGSCGACSFALPGLSHSFLSGGHGRLAFEFVLFDGCLDLLNGLTFFFFFYTFPNIQRNFQKVIVIISWVSRISYVYDLPVPQSEYLTE